MLPEIPGAQLRVVCENTLLTYAAPPLAVLAGGEDAERWDYEDIFYGHRPNPDTQLEWMRWTWLPSGEKCFTWYFELPKRSGRPANQNLEKTWHALLDQSTLNPRRLSKREQLRSLACLKKPQV